MSKCLLEGSGLVKYFGDRKILEVPQLRVYAGDRIGIVGANGSGKTTLLHLLSGTLAPETGTVRQLCGISYLQQFGSPAQEAGRQSLGQFGVAGRAGAQTVSGGEETRKKLARIFENLQELVFADEPTSNLDYDGVGLFCDKMEQAPSFLLISHDRSVLERLCNRIWEIRDGQIFFYDGGFAFYQQERARRESRAWKEYELYQEEKQRLTRIYEAKKHKAATVGIAPRNLDPREARLRNFLASRSYDVKQKNMERSAAAVKSRLEHLEVKEKPKQMQNAAFDFTLTDPPAGKIALRAEGVTLSYGSRILLKKGDFLLPRGSKTALMGRNGCGKTTLLGRIAQGSPFIRPAPKAKIGYFYQGFEALDFHKTVLENAMEGAVQSEGTVRSLLARLLFREDDVKKTASVLSGGERIKLSFAKLFASPSNLLLLDEPTNYLDLPSIEALQQMLREYEGTVLLVSHDREFIRAVAGRLLLMADGRLQTVECGLDEYESISRRPAKNSDMTKQVLELRLAAVVSKLSLARQTEKEALEAEYQELLKQLKAAQ